MPWYDFDAFVIKKIPQEAIEKQVQETFASLLLRLSHVFHLAGVSERKLAFVNIPLVLPIFKKKKKN